VPPLLSPDEFERIVAEAVATLPERFSKLIDNVVISVQDEPGPTKRGWETLGEYHGVPLTERSRYAPLVPDEITIFRGPISRVARNREDAVRTVQDTVIHEFGHYFGLADDDMPH
jgi:predicted Zn-dependent protease with MMP-like domain